MSRLIDDYRSANQIVKFSQARDSRDSGEYKTNLESVLVSDHDCDRQPSYEHCGEGTNWL